jgi:hypothetical protein
LIFFKKNFISFELKQSKWLVLIQIENVDQSTVTTSLWAVHPSDGRYRSRYRLGGIDLFGLSAGSIDRPERSMPLQATRITTSAALGSTNPAMVDTEPQRVVAAATGTSLICSF